VGEDSCKVISKLNVALVSREVDRFKVDGVKILQRAKKIEIKRGLRQEDRTAWKAVLIA
jgi:hypothetical protein